MKKSWRVKHHQKRLRAIRRCENRLRNTKNPIFKVALGDLRYYLRHKICTRKFHKAYQLMLTQEVNTNEKL